MNSLCTCIFVDNASCNQPYSWIGLDCCVGQDAGGYPGKEVLGSSGEKRCKVSARELSCNVLCQIVSTTHPFVAGFYYQ